MADAPAAPAPAAAPSTQAQGAAPDGGAGVPDGKPAEAAAPTLRELKVYGQVRQVPDDVYQRYAQNGAAFAQQREEIAKARAEHEARTKAWEEEVKTKTAEALRARGLDPDQWAAEHLVTQHERKSETPEQKELRESREKLAAYEKEKTETAKQQEQARVSEVAKRHREQVGSAFVAALKDGGIPEGPVSWPFVAKMAGYQENIDEQVLSGQMTPEEAQQLSAPGLLAKLAVEDIRNEHRVTFGNLRGDALAAAMGDEWLDRAVEAWVEKKERADATAQSQAGAAPVSGGAQRPVGAQGNGVRHHAGNGQFVSRETAAFLDVIGAK